MQPHRNNNNHAAAAAAGAAGGAAAAAAAASSHGHTAAAMSHAAAAAPAAVSMATRATRAQQPQQQQHSQSHSHLHGLLSPSLPRTPFSSNSSLPPTPSSAGASRSQQESSVDPSGFSNMSLLFGANSLLLSSDDESDADFVPHHSDDEEEAPRVSDIARRTRARMPLHHVPMEQLESQLVDDEFEELRRSRSAAAAAAAAAVSDANSLHLQAPLSPHPLSSPLPPGSPASAAPSAAGATAEEDSTYHHFLRMLRNSGPGSDDDDDDEEFQPDANQTLEEEEEEYRNDRTVSISKRELRELRGDRDKNMERTLPLSASPPAPRGVMSTRRSQPLQPPAALADPTPSPPSLPHPLTRATAASLAAPVVAAAAAAAAAGSTRSRQANRGPPSFFASAHSSIPTSAAMHQNRMQQQQQSGVSASSVAAAAAAASAASASQSLPLQGGHSMHLYDPTQLPDLPSLLPMGDFSSSFAPATGTMDDPSTAAAAAAPPLPFPMMPGGMPFFMPPMDATTAANGGPDAAAAAATLASQMQLLLMMQSSAANTAAAAIPAPTVDPTAAVVAPPKPAPVLPRADWTESQRHTLIGQLNEHVQLLVQVRYLSLNSVLTPLPPPRIGRVKAQPTGDADNGGAPAAASGADSAAAAAAAAGDAARAPVLSLKSIWDGTSELLTELWQKREQALERRVQARIASSSDDVDPFANPLPASSSSSLECRPALTLVPLLDAWKALADSQETEHTHAQMVREQEGHIPMDIKKRLNTTIRSDAAAIKQLQAELEAGREEAAAGESSAAAADSSLHPKGAKRRGWNWYMTPLFRSFISSDTQSQIRARLLPHITAVYRKSLWTPAEDLLLQKGYERFGHGGGVLGGPDWARMKHRYLPGRTVSEMQHRFNNLRFKILVDPAKGKASSAFVKHVLRKELTEHDYEQQLLEGADGDEQFDLWMPWAAGLTNNQERPQRAASERKEQVTEAEDLAAAVAAAAAAATGASTSAAAAAAPAPVPVPKPSFTGRRARTTDVAGAAAAPLAPTVPLAPAAALPPGITVPASAAPTTSAWQAIHGLKKTRGCLASELSPEELERLRAGLEYFPADHKTRWKSIADTFLPHWDRLSLRRAYYRHEKVQAKLAEGKKVRVHKANPNSWYNRKARERMAASQQFAMLQPLYQPPLSTEMLAMLAAAGPTPVAPTADHTAAAAAQSHDQPQQQLQQQQHQQQQVTVEHSASFDEIDVDMTAEEQFGEGTGGYEDEGEGERESNSADEEYRPPRKKRKSSTSTSVAAARSPSKNVAIMAQTIAVASPAGLEPSASSLSVPSGSTVLASTVPPVAPAPLAIAVPAASVVPVPPATSVLPPSTFSATAPAAVATSANASANATPVFEELDIDDDDNDEERGDEPEEEEEEVEVESGRVAITGAGSSVAVPMLLDDGDTDSDEDRPPSAAAALAAAGGGASARGAKPPSVQEDEQMASHAIVALRASSDAAAPASAPPASPARPTARTHKTPVKTPGKAAGKSKTPVKTPAKAKSKTPQKSTPLSSLAHSSELVVTVPAPLLAPVSEQLTYSAESLAYAMSQPPAGTLSPTKRPSRSNSRLHTPLYDSARSPGTQVARSASASSALATPVAAASSPFVLFPSFSMLATPTVTLLPATSSSTRPPRAARALAHVALAKAAESAAAGPWGVGQRLKASTQLLQGVHRAMNARAQSSPNVATSNDASTLARPLQPAPSAPAQPLPLPAASTAGAASSAVATSATTNAGALADNWLQSEDRTILLAAKQFSLRVGAWPASALQPLLREDQPPASRRTQAQVQQRLRFLMDALKPKKEKT